MVLKKRESGHDIGAVPPPASVPSKMTDYTHIKKKKLRKKE